MRPPIQGRESWALGLRQRRWQRAIGASEPYALQNNFQRSGITLTVDCAD